MDFWDSLEDIDPIPSAEPTPDGYITLPLLLVDQQVVLPGALQEVSLHGPSRLQPVDIALDGGQTLIVSLFRDDETSDTGDAYSDIATECAIIDLRDPDFTGLPSYYGLFQGRRRVKIEKVIKRRPAMIVRARIIEDDPVQFDVEYEDEDGFRPYREQLIDYMLRRWRSVPLATWRQLQDVFRADDPGLFSNLVAAYTLDSHEDLLFHLRTTDVPKRLQHLQSYLEREVNDLEADHADYMDKARKLQDAILAQSYKNIEAADEARLRRQQSEPQSFDASVREEVDALAQRMEAAQLPAEVQTKAQRELTRLRTLSPLTQEASIIRTYLDWLVSLPWHQATEDNLDLDAVQRVLDAEHYGLKKAKERIVEHIAVRKLAGDKMRSPILCFVGPPGVGKTSLGRSIAHALGREFVRISLGGVHDEAEIRGHRRTYVSALPGRVIQAMQRAGTVNPVLLLDEIDKIWAASQGDPRAALLEVLDPEQNRSFGDHYLEVPYDLSQVMFIATANDLYPLPEALEDRMEVIEFYAYTEEEKLDIAQQFLIPRQLEAHGISAAGIKFQADALTTIIRQYTMEAGVRNLDREIAKVCRKLAVRIAAGQKTPTRITGSLAEKYLGAPSVLPTHINRADSIGIVTSLSWTSDGGDVQAIEVTLTPGKGNLTLTGQLGDVLQESAQAALTYMRTRAKDFGIPHDDFENYDVHVHMPEGGIPKDGPSAGITITTAIVSAFTERPIRSDTAMTGEVTLRGHVLPVGGIKDKVLAARRHGIQQVIVPQGNAKDLTEIPKTVLKDVDIRLASHMQEVLDWTLLAAPEQRQRDIDNADDADDDKDDA